MRRLLIAAAVALTAAPAWAAQPVQLRAEVTDADGRVTLGELFEGAGAAGAVVVAARTGSGVVLDAALVQRAAMLHGLAWDNAAGVRRIIVRSSAPAADRATGGQVQALTYTRNLAAGDLIGPDDLVWSKVAAAPSDAPRDADDLIGMAAKRPLRQGAAAARRDASAPIVVKRDDTVSVSYSAEGVSLQLQAKALQAAAAGDTFNLVNPSSKKIIQAVCTGPGQAVIGPEADRFKTALAADPRLFASR